jgi:hypothetical protein
MNVNRTDLVKQILLDQGGRYVREDGRVYAKFNEIQLCVDAAGQVSSVKLLFKGELVNGFTLPTPLALSPNDTLKIPLDAEGRITVAFA